MDKDIEKLAKRIASQTGNDSLEYGTLGFARFMMYSCVFFHALYNCGQKGRCGVCKAEKVICEHLKLHPELSGEAEYRNEILREKGGSGK